MNLLIREDERIAFDMYFASIGAMQVHPGAGSKEHKIMSLEECRDRAFQMLDIRRHVFSAVVAENAPEREG